MLVPSLSRLGVRDTPLFSQLPRTPSPNLHHFLSFPLHSQYADERDLPYVMSLVDAELSEPYSIFTYR